MQHIQDWNRISTSSLQNIKVAQSQYYQYNIMIISIQKYRRASHQNMSSHNGKSNNNVLVSKVSIFHFRHCFVVHTRTSNDLQKSSLNMHYKLYWSKFHGTIKMDQYLHSKTWKDKNHIIQWTNITMSSNSVQCAYYQKCKIYDILRERAKPK